jgi:glycosyltransferase involved in cell wall biosynthesis
MISQPSEEEKPLVSVFVIAYKHDKYIGQCLQSIVDQKTNFKFDVLVGEDCSPDNTRAICETYAEKYPDIIKLLPAEANMGAIKNGIRTFKACTGKYIAMCEGDDYWCDNTKLQLQTDFLEANPDYSLCFSSVWVKDDYGNDLPYENYYNTLHKEVYTLEDFVISEKNIVPTPSVVFRNVLPDPYPKFFLESLVGDMPVQLFAGDKGKARFINKRLAVYRDHDGGVTKSEVNIKRGDEELIKLFNGFNEFTNFRHDKLFQRRFCNMARYNLISGSGGLNGLSRFRNYVKWFPQYLKHSDKIDIKEIFYYHTLLFSPWLLRFINRHKDRNKA